MSIHLQPSTATCIQKYLGTSYDVVKQVADNLEFLKDLADVSELAAILEQVNISLAEAEEVFANISGSLADKQDLLISGTNIKTINNVSLLGSGNMTLQGAGVVSITQLQTAQDNLEQLILMGV